MDVTPLAPKTPATTSSTQPSPGARAFDVTAEVLGRAGIYVHFPWCLAKCPYCDFVSYVAPTPPDHAAYADAVIRELHARTPLTLGRRIATVFFGGGTPSLWEPAQLGRVLHAIRTTLDCAPDVEVTVECNPTSLDEDRARALADAGVNRLSIGVQSLDDARLRFLGRLHDARGAIAAVRGAIRAGIPRVSGDLIFGLPDQSPEAARDEALALADLGPTHLSCYQLTIEAGTRFGELARRGRLPLADDGAVADAFLAIDAALSGRGFRHYEVSNYARPGDEARHNIAYWRGDEYLGLGCGAYGYARVERGRGVRWRNPVVPEQYVEATRAADAAKPDTLSESREDLDAQTLLRERIMLGLRMEEGIDLGHEARDLGAAGWTPAREREAATLVRRGRLERDGDRVWIPPAAWLWTDDTAARLF
jgi:putative oxygen-independent coproporphyrinogen III oxidase